MKKATRFISLLLAVVTIIAATVSLSSCEVIDFVTEEYSKALESQLEAIESSKEAEELAKEYSRGTADGLVYSSAYLNLQVTVSSGWKFLNDDEIAALSGSAKDIFSDEQFASAVDTTRFEFYAQSTSGDNANMTIVRNSVTDPMSKLATDTSNYLVSLYTNAGYTATASEPVAKTLADKEFTSLSVKVETGTVTMNQYLYIAEVNGYVISLTFTSAAGISQEEFESWVTTVAQ